MLYGLLGMRISNSMNVEDGKMCNVIVGSAEMEPPFFQNSEYR